MPSDGISRDDWDIVTELAVDIVNSDSEVENAHARSRLLTFLDALEAKYGALPSILATRADYIDDAGVKESLLNDAYCLAELRKDLMNALHVSHSLATLYVEELNDGVKGRQWLSRLKSHLDENHDESYLNDFHRLSEMLDNCFRGQDA